MAIPWQYHGNNMASTRHVIAMLLTWHCHVGAMVLPRYCNDIVMVLRDIAMVLQWYRHAIAMAIALQLNCNNMAITWQ